MIYQHVTQSTESLPSSQAETLSMQVDSPTESLCSQDRSSHAQASQRTIPLESQRSRSSLHRHLTNGANGARNSTAPASVVSVVDIVNYEINPGGGGPRRRSLQPSSHPDSETDGATRPARRRRIQELSPTLSYIHTHTLTTPNYSEPAMIPFHAHTLTHPDTH